MTSPTPGLDEAVEAAYRARAGFFASDDLTYDEYMDPDGYWAGDRDIVADAVGHAYEVIAARVRAATLDEVEAILDSRGEPGDIRDRVRALRNESNPDSTSTRTEGQ